MLRKAIIVFIIGILMINISNLFAVTTDKPKNVKQEIKYIYIKNFSCCSDNLKLTSCKLEKNKYFKIISCPVGVIKHGQTAVIKVATVPSEIEKVEVPRKKNDNDNGNKKDLTDTLYISVDREGKINIASVELFLKIKNDKSVIPDIPEKGVEDPGHPKTPYTYTCSNFLPFKSVNWFSVEGIIPPGESSLNYIEITPKMLNYLKTLPQGQQYIAILFATDDPIDGRTVLAKNLKKLSKNCQETSYYDEYAGDGSGATYFLWYQCCGGICYKYDWGNKYSCLHSPRIKRASCNSNYCLSFSTCDYFTGIKFLSGDDFYLGSGASSKNDFSSLFKKGFWHGSNIKNIIGYRFYNDSNCCNGTYCNDNDGSWDLDGIYYYITYQQLQNYYNQGYRYIVNTFTEGGDVSSTWYIKFCSPAIE